MSIEIIFCTALVSTCSVIAWAIGFDKGRARGIAEGWNEHREECVARDRSRRQRNGQFKAKTGGQS